MQRTLTFVVGAGRLGRELASRHALRDRPVALIDHDAASLDRLEASFGGDRVVADAADLSALREAGFDRALAVFATTDDDCLNLMVAQAAVHVFRVPQVWARTTDPARYALARELGIPAVCGTDLLASTLLDRMGA